MADNYLVGAKKTAKEQPIPLCMRDLPGNPAMNPASRIPIPSGTGVQPWVDSIIADSNVAGFIGARHIFGCRSSMAMLALVVAS